MTRLAPLFVLLPLVGACSTASGGLFARSGEPAPAADQAPAKPAQPPLEKASRRTVPEGATAPLFGDLGSYSYPISSKASLAQRFFDQGLTLTYGFNHAEAIRSFREAANIDPDCAMCFWGVAYGYGPNINKPMDDADVPSAWEALQEARRVANRVTEKERDLVEALAKRYASEPVEDRSGLDQAYAAAMKEVARRYPDDPDVQTLYVESVMDTMPWNYYREDGNPKPETEEIVSVLEAVLKRHPDHFGAIHLYIHAVEPSSTPERAEAPADRLRALVPGAGHLVHMPSHIYLRVGRYNDASLANQKAAEADESYIAQCRAQGFYPAAYYSHNIHFLWAAASFEGRSQVALDAARKLVKVIPPEMVKEFAIVEEFLPTELVALARFGRWDDVLAAPEPADDLRYLKGIWHYVRGVAFAARSKTGEARKELEAVRALRDEWAARKDFVFASGSSPAQLLGIAAHVLEARVAGANGKWSGAIEPLREAVKLQDTLPYTEPPPWYFPVREALGHALLGAGRTAEAEAVYREQLEKTPRDGWALFGLVASLRAQGKEVAAADIEREFQRAWQLADVKLDASIF